VEKADREVRWRERQDGEEGECKLAVEGEAQ
jgi:hypothetical protein